jgi:4-hydroxyacetophenone monooxygenase
MTEDLKPADVAITEDDAFLAAVLQEASIPTLMMSLVHITGDTSLLDGTIRPKAPTIGEVQGFLCEEDRAAVRAKALEVLKAYRDGGCRLPAPPSIDTVRRMMNFVVGSDVPEDYVPMMLEELALDGHDQRSVKLERKLTSAERDAYHVVVIGAGLSGLVMGLRLKEMGVPFTVVEKNPELGGTWYENRYPGCRVDIPSHFYSYSFEPSHEWTQFFATRDELNGYFNRFADKHGLRPHIRFQSEVAAATWDEASKTWSVTLRDAGGSSETMTARALVSAVGQLNRPLIPDIEGQKEYKGLQVHSAQWRPGIDLKGKRVAVIGTGATAVQLVPELAKVASKLFVFQRSPIWLLPNPKYHDKVSDGKRWLLKHLPYYARWYRFVLFWPGTDGMLPNLRIDPTWPHADRSINAHNEGWRNQLVQYIESQVGDDPELLKKVVPPYPVMVKRMNQDNGSWFRTLKQSHVELVTGKVERIDAAGIVCDGRHHDVDAIVYCTGFQANKFLWPMHITGRSGRELQEVWGEEARAYLGITVPEFPNLFCMYGPATNLAHAGSIILHSECQARYIVGCVKALIDGHKQAMAVKRDVFERFNTKLVETLGQMVWSHKGTTTWYRNKAGRVVNTSPWRLVDYREWTRAPKLDEYDFA